MKKRLIYIFFFQHTRTRMKLTSKDTIQAIIIESRAAIWCLQSTVRTFVKVTLEFILCRSEAKVIILMRVKQRDREVTKRSNIDKELSVNKQSVELIDSYEK